MSKNKSKSRSSDRPFNILFSCVGKRVSLLGSFRKALEELGLEGELVGTDITTAAPAMHVVDHPELVPPAGTLHYTPRLIELVEKHKIRLLIPLTDLDLRVLARHAAKFEALGCTVMISSQDVVSVCRNKLEFSNVVNEAGLHGIHTMDLKAFKGKPFYPCFVKPVHGSAAFGAGRVRNERELKAHVRTFGEQLIVQEYVPGQEFTVDVFRRRDGVICAVVPRQRLSIRTGEVEKGIAVNDPQLIEATLRLLEHLPGCWGVINAQCRRPSDGQPRFFEINLRFGGGAPLSIAAGANLPKMVIQEVLGQTVEPAIGQFADKTLMLRYPEAIFTTVDDPTKLPGYQEPDAK